MKQSSLLPPSEGNMDANDLGEIPLNLSKKPIHGRDKELRNFKETVLTPSSTNVAPQISSSGKRTHSLYTDGGDLLPTNQTLNDVEDVHGHDLGHQRSCYGDSGDVVDQKSDANSSGLKLVEASAKPSFPPMASEPSIFDGDEVRHALQLMKWLTQSSLVMREKTIQSFFKSVHSFQYAQLNSTQKFSKESCSEILSLKSAHHVGLKSLIEEKSKQTEAANISSLQQAKLMSEEEENRFQQMKMDLCIFKIIF
ncbi:hypothetical protein LIER_30128 [Lithospermum erythrorhizon]|uniref:Uncharacterized protein n=1 Tax=Lithospermum erythrorhizon TaxID=34254 RepID=A0AAV3RQ96_LITER